jgi:hypothetical protein
LPLAQSLQSQEYKFKFQVLEGTWYWTTRVDVSHASPVYSVADIRSPFGLLRDSIAIPGDVVKSMADSIAGLMSAFVPGILLGATSLTFHLDEGRGWGDPQALQVANSGVFGSILDAVLTTSAASVQATPDTLGGLSAGAAGTTQVSADSTNLLAINSPYAATILVQDPTAVNNPQVVSITLVVRPKAHVAVSPTSQDYHVVAPISGPFPPIPNQAFTVTNSGDGASMLDFQVQKLNGNSPWLIGISPLMGSLAGGASMLVTTIVQPADGTGPGVYYETLRVSGYSDNSYIDVPVTLTVT